MEQQNTHLRTVKISGFKSIKKLDLEMRPVNILIGANGAGKTNFISLFYGIYPKVSCSTM